MRYVGYTWVTYSLQCREDLTDESDEPPMLNLFYDVGFIIYLLFIIKVVDIHTYQMNVVGACVRNRNKSAGQRGIGATLVRLVGLGQARRIIQGVANVV